MLYQPANPKTPDYDTVPEYQSSNTIVVDTPIGKLALSFGETVYCDTSTSRPYPGENWTININRVAYRVSFHLSMTPAGTWQLTPDNSIYMSRADWPQHSDTREATPAARKALERAIVASVLPCMTPYTDAWLIGQNKAINNRLHYALKTLAENAGKSPEYVMEKVMSPVADWRRFGWNALTGEYGDMFQMGIIDPLRVVRVALESAASVASLMLITSTLVANERK